ncbi:hypothetical protein H9L39_17511 [Fusarium oxysporum f. sp. albedinis]|nr:hypothetical protein H9L39_17511 [Fusarium oxysporum f. sp. albedinis]
MLSSIQDYTASGVGTHTIEVRRGFNGDTNFTSVPGESYHSNTGEPGGPYPGYNWVFDSVPDGAAIGDAGQVLDGAAGDELGCVDEKLGTPAETAVLAVTEGIDDMYQPVKEDYTAFVAAQGGATSPKGRSDIAVFEIADGGGVFSLDLHAGSLACHPTGSRITRRLL